MAGTTSTDDDDMHASTSYAAAAPSQHLLGKHCIVVGAGPSGAVAAIQLARFGASVSVYERTLGTSTSIGTRSYSILLSRRGVLALEEAGVQLPASELRSLPAAARYMGGKKPSMGPPMAHARIINRGTLAGLLVAEAQRRFPDRIKIHFGATLSELNLAARKATFTMEDGNSVSTGYEFLVGADGSSSRVRACFRDQVPGFSFTQQQDEMEYRTIELPPTALSDADPGFRTRMNALMDQKRNASVLAFPESSGELRGVYIRNHGEHGSMRCVEDYVRDMKASFPALREEDLPALAAQLLAQPVSNGGLSTRCSQLHGPSAVLVGDSGHGMWPSLGQGANAALESVGVLARVLAECKDLSKVPEQYNALRHKDALAVVELTERGMGGKNQRVRGTSFAMVLLMLQFMAHKALPALVPKPALFTMNDTLTSYSEIKRRSERQGVAVRLVLAAGATALVAAAAQLLAPAATAYLGRLMTTNV